MKKEIIADVNPFETRVAVVEDGELVEAYFERDRNERIVGNMYLGRVANILPGMEAAFVDIGQSRNAFLHAGDILVDRSDFVFGDEQVVVSELKPQIDKIIKQGQEIMVQVVKEPNGAKGARVTTHMTLPGRLVVLMPTVNNIGVSRRIEDEEERRRLKALIEGIKPSNMGIIVRTDGRGRGEEEFRKEINYLVKLWEHINAKTTTLTAPCLVHAEEDLLSRTLRDMFTSDVDAFYINDREQYERISGMCSTMMPVLKDRILYSEQKDIFSRYDIEEKLAKALQRKVWLKCGGYIVIDYTEALTAIDVNTGKNVGVECLQETILQTNLEAAEEIAKQIRLRDIGGIIVIDFIDMDKPEYQQRVLQKMEEELKKDRTKSHLIGMTGLGLVEMTRKKVRKSLNYSLQNSCTYCDGTGYIVSPETVAMKARRLVIAQLSRGEKTLLVTVNPMVALAIMKKEQKNFFGCGKDEKVYLKSDSNMPIGNVNVSPFDDSEGFEDSILCC